jgi:hypothetical protein
LFFTIWQTPTCQHWGNIQFFSVVVPQLIWFILQYIQYTNIWCIYISHCSVERKCLEMIYLTIHSIHNTHQPLFWKWFIFFCCCHQLYKAQGHCRRSEIKQFPIFFSNFIQTWRDRNLENPKNKYTLSNTMEAAICNQIYPWLGEPGNSFAFCNEFFLSQVFWGSKRLGTTPIHNYLIHSHLIHRHLIPKHLMQKHSNSTANHSDFF